MTIPNRTVSITGIFAADANTTIPANPVTGISYRDTAMTGTIVREGWPFKTIVDSSKFNQAMFEYSSVTAQFEKYGFLPWSNLTDYVTGSVCLGSNGILYQALQDTGPSTTPYDPTTNRSVWTQIILGNTNELFDFKWVDHKLIRQDWLRADTFSWHPATTQYGTYLEAYNHLVDDISGKTLQSETVGSTTIQFYLADDGHKICPASEESNVSAIYTATGIAWYYILDTTNQRFKLPRTKYGFVGLRDTVGEYVPESLPNIKGYPDYNDDNTDNYRIKSFNPTGAFVKDSQTNVSPFSSQGTSTTTLDTARFDASAYCSTYQDNAPVQQRATQMYLYFYVGEFSQSATEQTAGLNSELFNGKVDLDFNNMNPSENAKSTIRSWGMPDYASTVSRSNNTQYTADTDGYLVICGWGNSNVIIDGISFRVGGRGHNYEAHDTSVWMIQKGTVYTTPNLSNSQHKFIPLKGV